MNSGCDWRIYTDMWGSSDGFDMPGLILEMTNASDTVTNCCKKRCARSEYRSVEFLISNFNF